MPVKSMKMTIARQGCLTEPSEELSTFVFFFFFWMNTLSFPLLRVLLEQKGSFEAVLSHSSCSVLKEIPSGCHCVARRERVVGVKMQKHLKNSSYTCRIFG